MNAPVSIFQPQHPAPGDGTVLTDEDRARAHHYALLGNLFFAAPEAPLLTALAASARVLGSGDTPFATAWAALGEIAAGSDTASVHDEYHTLFFGIGRPDVMLFGSFYLAGFLMEEPLAELRDDLAELGLARRPGVAETEDHIAALAEVMRHLVITGPDEAGLARQRLFFTRHLQPWYARLADALAAAPQARFYARAGALMRAFFDIESEAFAME
ncbi:molecular chaperone TorD family protein [Aromatoleum toluclasticum]|uniref:TorD/DmsD family molecular chaperone n=1 Tax=Aromatoleum toluclasticum TaxID=92003 RepID=UPI00037786EE|nr:molecular chaperone TorD family protein [Aromatoleum toluclasticum]MCC4114490.1 molecular chaperone TorD family protein [Aromatoleum toluclasticum]